MGWQISRRIYHLQYAGGQETKGRKANRVQDFSNVTIGKLPSKGLSAKPKPDKLVNQFFAKELVNPKPKTSIKIGLITSKIKAAPEPVALAPGLEICPVTPPDGYSMRSKENVDEATSSQGIQLIFDFSQQQFCHN